MRKLILAALAVGAIGGSQLMSTAPAQASVTYPYCIQGAQGGYPGDCSYRSFTDCMRTADGKGGNCVANPRYAYWDGRSNGPMDW
ncbi:MULTISPECIES: DUF3551 domain-containing protein [Rhodopseudomonas]|uniref:DUF3551 domain-containing protein n=1 Tax=Rhodopseudomonas palustris TaxID=1076 RepID=A0A0D7EYJ7_RHOPL|nr:MULTISPECIES: DUF3551 domain-containing protein [Rhodopseudomonas]KIZ45878.1 hypothetical protein OO17_07310 [Rhodopseudomonas palustris]MDF3814169.1 DUF3551 domain-containing protein [Rhodopseudomonas sp. BAL398]WOK16179.1 DUF3551 domain-containing protein [Rhodopseudomonas sp. BAL398]